MKKKLLIFGKVAASVLLLGYLFSMIDLKVVLSHFASADLAILALAYVLLLGQTALSAFKWKVILKTDGVNLPYRFLLRTYFIGGFLSLFLPTSIGGDVYRVVAVKNGSRSLGKSVSSVVFDRLTGLFALLSIALWSYLFFPGRQHELAIFSAYVLAIVLFLVLLSKPVLARLQAFGNGLLAKLLDLLKSFVVYRNDVRQLLLVLGLALFFQLNIVFLNKMYCVALGVDIPLAYLLVVIPLIYLTEMLPISINGLGVRESAFVFFFVQLGATKEEGLAVALLVVLMRYLAGLVGGFVLLATSLRARAEATAR